MVYRTLKRIPLTTWILISMVVGVVIGVVAPQFAVTLKPVATVNSIDGHANGNGRR